MAGLNDDLNEDLDEGFDPSTMAGLEQPKSDESKKSITLVTPVEKTGQDIPADLSEEMKTNEPGELPNLDAKFALVEEGRTKVVELQQIEDMIQGQGGVSQESANYLEHVTGNFFHAKLSPKEFTKTPSQTNLVMTNNFLKMRIAKEEAALVDCVKAIGTEPLEELKLFQHHIEHIYCPFVKDQTITIQRTYENVIENIESSKNTVLPVGSDFINIVKTRLNVLAIDAIEFSQVSNGEANLPNQFTASLNLIKSLFDCPKFSMLFAEMYDRDFGKNSESEEPFIPEVPNLIELVSLYKDNRIMAALDDLEEGVKNAVNEFAELTREMADKTEAMDELNAYLLSNAQRIKDLTSNIMLMHTFSKKLIALNFAMCNVFAFLKYCI